jgi:hypothetical protein
MVEHFGEGGVSEVGHGVFSLGGGYPARSTYSIFLAAASEGRQSTPFRCFALFAWAGQGLDL